MGVLEKQMKNETYWVAVDDHRDDCLFREGSGLCI